MGLYHAIETLAADWDVIRADLGDDTFAEFLDLVTQFVMESAPDLSDGIAKQIARLLSESLVPFPGISLN